MDKLALSVADASAAPVITLDRARLAERGIDAMLTDFETLIASGHGFVLTMSGDRGAETPHDDQKRWVLWLKQNSSRLAATCRGFVYMLDTTTDAALQEKQAAGMEAMLGVPVRLARDSADVDAIAADLMR